MRRIVADEHSPGALAQFRAVRICEQGQVRVGGQSEPERLGYRNLPVRIVQMVGAANDVGYLHVTVVYYRGKVVGRHAVRARDHQVIELCGVYFHVAPHEVHERDGSLARRMEPDHERSARPLPGRSLGSCETQARPRIAKSAAFPLRLLTQHIKFIGRAPAPVRVTVRQELFNMCAIKRKALTLTIGPIVAAGSMAFVPIEAQPTETIEHAFNVLV